MVVDTETLWAKGKVADYDHYSTFEGGEEGGSCGEMLTKLRNWIVMWSE